MLWHSSCTEPEIQRQTADKDWVCSTLCGAHVCHNADCWAVRQHVDKRKEDTKNMCIIMESLNNSYHEILTHYKDLLQRLDWVDPPASPDCVKQWRVLVGLSPVLVELCTDLDLRWDYERGVLMVSREAQQRDDVIGDICTALQGVLHAVRWSEARWGRMGLSGRTHMGSLSIGLDYVMNSINNDTEASHRHSKGYSRTSPYYRWMIMSCIWQCLRGSPTRFWLQDFQNNFSMV
jgi:hypothetical protein